MKTTLKTISKKNSKKVKGGSLMRPTRFETYGCFCGIGDPRCPCDEQGFNNGYLEGATI